MPARVPPNAESSTRRRILAATFVVLARSGRKRLLLSEVAAEAKVSRPTLYRYFPSKEELLAAFGLYEQDIFDAGMAQAVAGLRGTERLDAALQFVVDFQHTYSLGFLADTEPEHVLAQMKRVMPILHERIARLIPGENADLAAATVVRVAVCHYLIAGGDRDRFLAELRYAAGIDPLRTSRSA
ncbi:TetR family transcriptional regulator [Mycobacterium intermedium]|uniref:TetR family transcriptional regulator n=1 Tax=Mycobacterium intermedium TaxID=28445 RepID=A0A1E3S8V6_MYCIE|nr:TetR/AcrR family transcriptional regulator [Mycobacterium intermedium]MCV6967715.1 TetR/AcrR family transcriptional regulator [Mycobacterium intermedium]ODQ98524.1 TetR family transcriptional regulator [Mycobacterium intermedium]OPE47494.1 TetR family transcriptional regulator [Mycobacterium intermedium]ORB03534.1 TetR family transcriptional regulator [Mycobacterium intermedium]